jgi:hypothetical protein
MWLPPRCYPIVGRLTALLRLVSDDRWRINLSVPLVFEYEQTLKGVCTGGHLTGSDTDSVVQFLRQREPATNLLFFGGHYFPIPRMIWFWNWLLKAGPIS